MAHNNPVISSSEFSSGGVSSSDEEIALTCTGADPATRKIIREYNDTLYLTEFVDNVRVIKCTECIKINRKKHVMVGELRKSNVVRHYSLVHNTQLVNPFVAKQVKFRDYKNKSQVIETMVRYHVRVGLPINSWDFPETKKLVLPYTEAFDLTISAAAMRKYVMGEYCVLKDKIAERLKNRMFSV